MMVPGLPIRTRKHCNGPHCPISRWFPLAVSSLNNWSNNVSVDSPQHIVALAQTYNDTKQFQLTIYFHKEDYKMLGSSLSK